jgi:ribosomal protein S18 acetylase RimI-like enzyme
VTVSFLVTPLAPHHDRSAFSCGVDALDRYLRAQAGQDMRRRIANCFVATPLDTTSVAGYYTLSAASIPVVDLPEDVSRRLPRYPVIPAALIGRLAVDRQYRRRGLGAALLFDALERAIRADAAVFAVIVDAKDETAAAFYARYGFRRFASRSQRLFLPIATATKLL